MKIQKIHEWNLSPKAAIEIQKQLAYEVVRHDDYGAPVKTVAGIDLDFDTKNETCRAVVVVLTFPELELANRAKPFCPCSFRTFRVCFRSAKRRLPLKHSKN